MKFWSAQDGRIIQAAQDDDAHSPLDDQPDVVVFLGPAVDRPGEYYRDGTSAQPLPPRPSDHHHFCHESCAWQLDEDRAWATMRARRDAMLAQCDWVVIRAHELGQEVPPEWMVYRQALRDIPQMFSDPLTIVWPVEPQT